MSDDTTIKNEPVKRLIFGPLPATSRTKYPPPPPPPPKDFYPRKPKFWQLRGTKAAAYRRTQNLIFTGFSMFVGYLLIRYWGDRKNRMMKFFFNVDEATQDEIEDEFVRKRTTRPVASRISTNPGHNPYITPAQIREDRLNRSGVGNPGRNLETGPGLSNWQQFYDKDD